MRTMSHSPVRPEVEPQSRFVQSAQRLRDAYTAAYACSDAAALASLFARDGKLFLIDGSVFSGPSEIEAFYQSEFESLRVEIEITTEDTSAVKDVAIVEVGNANFRGTVLETGEEFEVQMGFAGVYKRTRRNAVKIHRIVGFAPRTTERFPLRK